MLLVIPTHRRPNRQITLQELPEEVVRTTVLVTSDKEETIALNKLYGGRVGEVVTARNTTGIADKRHWIMRNLSKHTDAIFFMDDDLYFFERCNVRRRTYTKETGWRVSGNGSLLGRASPETITRTLQDVAAKFATHPVVGVASRMGNNRVQGPWEYNTRQMHAFGVRTDVYKEHKLNFGEIPFREDFNITLHLLRRGYPNALFCDTCVNPAAYNAAGGTSLERTVEKSNAAAVQLEEAHPGLVKVVNKEYATSTPRMEVIVQWKKAFNNA